MGAVLAFVIFRVLRWSVAFWFNRTVDPRSVVYRRDVLLRWCLGSGRLRFDCDIKETSFRWLFFIINDGIVGRP